MMVIFALPAGFVLGLLFYGGLWWTVQRIARASHPALLTIGSFWLRTAAALTGFLLVTGQSWQRALLCFAGVLAGRLTVSRLVSRRTPCT